MIIAAAPFYLAAHHASAQFDADGRVTIDLSVLEDGGYNRPRAMAPGASGSRRSAAPATAAAPASQFYGLPGMQMQDEPPPRAERRPSQPQQAERPVKKAEAPPAKAPAPAKRESAPLPPVASAVPAPPRIADASPQRPAATGRPAPATPAPPPPAASPPSPPLPSASTQALPSQTLAAPIVPSQTLGGPSASPAAVPPPPPPPAAAGPASPAPAAKPAPAQQSKPGGAKPTEQAARPPTDVLQGRVLQIRFTGEDVRIPADGQSGLKTLAEKIKDNDSVRLQLTAYAGGDQVTDSKARRLSLSRALAVRTFLIEQGVRSTRVEVRALGDKVPDEPLNRVDVTIADR